MEGTIHQSQLDIQTGIASQRTLFQADTEAFLNRWPEFSRNISTRYLGFEFETRPRLTRCNDVIDLRVLT